MVSESAVNVVDFQTRLPPSVEAQLKAELALEFGKCARDRSRYLLRFLRGKSVQASTIAAEDSGARVPCLP